MEQKKHLAYGTPSQKDLLSYPVKTICWQLWPIQRDYSLKLFLVFLTQCNNPLGLFVIFLIQVPTIAFRQLRELDHVNLNQVTLHIESHFQSFTIYMPKNLTKPNTHHNQPLPRTTSRFSRMVLSGVSAR